MRLREYFFFSIPLTSLPLRAPGVPLGSVHRLIVSPLPVQVSGCGDGLGRALSLQLARQGCRLICIDQNPLQVQETLGLVQSQQVGTQGRTAPYLCAFTNFLHHPGTK